MMGLLARAARDDIAAGLSRLSDLPAFDDLRAPEVGLVMLRGRMAGTGAPFNLGEATVARAAVRLADGAIGFGYALGRDLGHARLIALADALWADPGRRAEIETALLTPLRDHLAARDRTAAERTAATRVDFFTMVRGEDQVA
jgi:alpha-D-ribose 1-methylphosphonate 5-triphosphate synthase subunit PhnG